MRQDSSYVVFGRLEWLVHLEYDEIGILENERIAVEMKAERGLAFVVLDVHDTVDMRFILPKDSHTFGLSASFRPLTGSD